MAESYRTWPEHQAATALYDEFAATPYGEKLANASRYGLYRGSFTHEEWRRLLGRDVNNLLHMAYTLDLSAHFEQRRERLGIASTPERRGRKLKAAASHDNGEAITDDILYILKTKDDTAAESAEFTAHLPEFYKSPATQVEMKDIAESIIFNEESEEGQDFNKDEHAGYLQTGLKAWAMIKYGDLNDIGPEEKRMILGITASVLGSTLDKSLALFEANTYPEFTQFINNRSKIITEAFNEMPDEAFDIFGKHRQDRVNAFNEARIKWSAYFAEIDTMREAA